LDEDQPSNTNYKSSNSSFQKLIQNNVYQSVNILYICFVSTTITNIDTIPVGNGSSYTINIKPAPHSSGLTNQDYMNYVISDARRNNPNIKIAVTLDWGNGNLISDIFSTSKYSPQEAAKHFAANLMVYLKEHDLDGFDIDWERPISLTTTREQFTLLINAIGTEFKQQTNKHYYLTLSPAEVGNLDAKVVNTHIDFVNLQLYSGFTHSNMFENVGVNPNLFAYGAKFERAYQTATKAYQDNKDKYHYKIFTCWRLNSDNYIFEQTLWLDQTMMTTVLKSLSYSDALWKCSLGSIA
jgi:GH18 family chitinase